MHTITSGVHYFSNNSIARSQLFCLYYGYHTFRHDHMIYFKVWNRPIFPRRRWTSPTADIARTYRPACSGPAAIWFAAYLVWGSLPPACRWWAPPLLLAGAPSCRAAKPNGRPIPRFPFPRTFSAPLLISRSSYPLARRREMTPCPSRPRRRRIGRDRSPII